MRPAWALAVMAWAAVSAQSQPVALFTRFEQPPSPVAEQAMRDELAAIMEPTGMAFQWRALGPGGSPGSPGQLAVVTFHGNCGAANLAGPPRTSSALGWTHVSDGVVLPFSEVDCGGLRAFLQGGLLRLKAAEREAALGRAAARVLAHELYHVFAATRHHAQGGIAKPVYTPDELLSPAFHFDAAAEASLEALAPASAPEVEASRSHARAVAYRADK